MGKFINHGPELGGFPQSRIEGRCGLEAGRERVVGRSIGGVFDGVFDGVFGTNEKSQNATNV